MFGYVVPKECELKVREQAVYRSCYCGLCKRLKKEYGPVSSCFLTYDCTFLALLLDALSTEPVSVSPCRCLHACGTGKRKYRNETPALSFAAAVNCVLAHEKALDDVYDGGRLKDRLKGRFAALLLSRSAGKAARRYPGLGEAAASYTKAQRDAEKAHAGPDEAAEPTAAFLRVLPALSGLVPEKERPAAEWLFHHLGRWIYYADALEDKERDEKDGLWNVFSAPNADPSFCLYSAFHECENALAVMNLTRDEGLIENILGLGCAAKTASLLKTQGKEDCCESV